MYKDVHNTNKNNQKIRQKNAQIELQNNRILQGTIQKQINVDNSAYENREIRKNQLFNQITQENQKNLEKKRQQQNVRIMMDREDTKRMASIPDPYLSNQKDMAQRLRRSTVIQNKRDELFRSRALPQISKGQQKMNYPSIRRQDKLNIRSRAFNKLNKSVADIRYSKTPTNNHFKGIRDLNRSMAHHTLKDTISPTFRSSLGGSLKNYRYQNHSNRLKDQINENLNETRNETMRVHQSILERQIHDKRVLSNPNVSGLMGRRERKYNKTDLDEYHHNRAVLHANGIPGLGVRTPTNIDIMRNNNLPYDTARRRINKFPELRYK